MSYSLNIRFLPSQAESTAADSLKQERATFRSFIIRVVVGLTTQRAVFQPDRV